MLIRFLLPALVLISGTQLLAQNKSRHSFGDRLMLGVHYGYSEDYVGDRQTLFENEHFFGARAGVTVARNLYAGIQSRLIRAGNYETPAQDFYMAGVFARWYLLHPVKPHSSDRFGAFLETGFMIGNYAFENRNAVQYPFEKPGSWYLPCIVGLEFRIWRKLTLEGGLNLYLNNGKKWNDQGIAYLSLGANWHW